MTKKTIEIEIPDGKVEKISRDRDTISIKFVDDNIFEHVKTLRETTIIAEKLYPKLYKKWAHAESGSYEENLYAYRMVVAVLTNNEKNHLTSGKGYYPYIQFWDPCKIKDHSGDNIVGYIESEGKEFIVTGGGVGSNTAMGLGHFHSDSGVSGSWTNVGFLIVSSKEVAWHISKYFGRLVFDLMYSEANCNYKWINK